MVRRIEEGYATDPRPWYVKNYPWFRSKQIVKLVPTEKGVFWDNIQPLTKITRKWMKRLLVTEVNDYYDRETYARFRGCFDDKEGFVEPISEPLKKGDFTVIMIDMLTFNWGAFTIRKFEINLVHELLHVVDPDKAIYVSKDDGLRHENEVEMKKWTQEIIARFGSLGTHELKNAGMV